MTKIITSTGYGGTGSSAITDLLKEFEGGICAGNEEFWFLQDLNGVSDLEYFLIDGNHRSKVDKAIKNYLQYVKKHNHFYSKFFSDKFEIFSRDYVNSLIDVKFKKSISEFDLDSDISKFLLFNFSIKIQYIYWNFFSRKYSEFSPYVPKIEKYYCSIDKEFFYKKTKEYTSKLFAVLNPNKKKIFLAFDQLVPAMNSQRYFNYIDNLKVVIVDRDPRDLFLLNEIKWKGAAYICDTKNINEYINWYRSLRKHKVKEFNKNNNTMYLNFEDLVYNYDKTLKMLLDFFELPSKLHKFKKMFFNPDDSKINTRLWASPHSYKYEIELIESELHKYCYE